MHRTRPGLMVVVLGVGLAVGSAAAQSTRHAAPSEAAPSEAAPSEREASARPEQATSRTPRVSGWDATGIPIAEVAIDGIDDELQSNARAFLALARRQVRVHSEPELKLLVEDGVDEVARSLQPFGYYRPQVVGTWRRTDGGFLVTYRVDPGVPVMVRSVDVEVTGDGGDESQFQDVVGDFPVTTGDRLSHRAYERGKASLAAIAGELGYLDAQFEAAAVRVDVAAGVADVEVRFATGRRHAFGEVRFVQDFLDDEMLAGYVPFRVGEPFELEQLLRLERALSETPYFSRVTVRPLRDRVADGQVPIEVALEPAPGQAYLVGGGYGTDSGPRASLDVELRRINRAGHRGQLQLDVATEQSSASAQYVVPEILTRGSALSFTGRYLESDPSTSTSSTAAGEAVYSRPRGLPRGRWKESWSMAFERDSYEVGVDSGTSRMLLSGLEYSYLSVDDIVLPRRARSYRLAARAGHRSVGSDVSLLTVHGRGEIVQGVGSRGRILTRLEVGVLRASQFRALPPRLRWFAGGSDSLRGFARDSRGPRDVAGNVIGGDSLVVASVEYEHRLFDRWAVALFHDAGNAFDGFQGEVEHGSGVGLRWRSPVGSVRLDGAFAVSRPGAPLRLHLSVGTGR